MQEKLDDTNFLLYAAKNYNNEHCYDTVEFYDDLKRFNYVKRLLNQYVETGELKERLILNHIIILYNVFGPIPITRMLFFKLKNRKEQVKPFLELLNILPETIENIGMKGETFYTINIPSDERIKKVLENI